MILFLLLFLVGVPLWILCVEPNWFRIRHKTVRIQKPIGRALTVIHLSDLHFTKRRFFLERFFDRLSRLDADFVFVTGDLIDGPGGIGPCVQNLEKLKPRKGIYVVLGNHDYRNYPFIEQMLRIITKKHYGSERDESEQLKKALVRAGIHLLTNQNVSVPLSDNQNAVVIGIDDPVTGRANFNQAFQGITNGVLHLALIHSPAPFPILDQRGIDVAFAGHTHGGQIRIPGIGPLPYVYKLEPIIDSTDRYGFVGLVSRGMGATPLIRFRLFCRPEAVFVRIEAV